MIVALCRTAKCSGVQPGACVWRSHQQSYRTVCTLLLLLLLLTYLLHYRC
jgi:hypothetical protein